jgi:hypothetical protein
VDEDVEKSGGLEKENELGKKVLVEKGDRRLSLRQPRFRHHVTWT